jgi:hypothetical protein
LLDLAVNTLAYCAAIAQPECQLTQLDSCLRLPSGIRIRMDE